MKIKNLAIGHGVIYYEVTFYDMERSDMIRQYIAFKYCFGGIQIVKFSIPGLSKHTNKTIGFKEIKLGLRSDYPCQ
jgi:hypothetical protein